MSLHPAGVLLQHVFFARCHPCAIEGLVPLRETHLLLTIDGAVAFKLHLHAFIVLIFVNFKFPLF